MTSDRFSRHFSTVSSTGRAKNEGEKTRTSHRSDNNMAAKMSKFGVCSANGHTEMNPNTASTKAEKVVILDAGAQYGKVSLKDFK